MTTWTDEQLADYECALETIGNVIALKAREIEQERAKPLPDAAHVTELRRQQASLADERGRLRIGQHDAVARAIEQYGKLVREST